MNPSTLRLTVKNQILSLERPCILGILNLTTDSFYAPSRVGLNTTETVDRAGAMLNEGADILDLGACSTRPGSTQVDPVEEEERIQAGLEAILSAFPGALISVDTYRASVAQTAIRCGAGMINDVSGGTLDPQMHPLILQQKVPYILGHLRGRPENMASLTNYSDAPTEVFDFLIQNAEALKQAGAPALLLDPCFGFAKNQGQNYQILQRLPELVAHEWPVMAGLSRKSMIYRPLGLDPSRALNGTTALHAIALTQGARLLRVHDVVEAVECVNLWCLFQNREDLLKIF
jgi:dihydropteroate synthase